MGLSPIRLVISCNVLISTQLEGVFPLVGLAGDGDNLVRTQGLGEQDTKVSQSTDSYNSDLLAGTAAVVLERRVERDTTAHHGCGLSRGDGIGDLNDEVRGSTVVQSVSTVRLVAVVVDAIVRANHSMFTVLLHTGGTLLAVALTAQTRVVLGSDTNTVTDLDASLGLGTNADGDTDDFVTDTAGVHGEALE